MIRVSELNLEENKYYRMNKKIMKIKENKKLIIGVIEIIGLLVEAVILTSIILAL